MNSFDSFAQSWNRLGQHGQIVYRSILEQIDMARREIERTGNMVSFHSQAHFEMRDFFEAVPNFDFRFQPEPRAWIEWAQDPGAVVATHLAAWERIEALMLGHGVNYTMRWNSLKRGYAVRRIIEAFERTGQPPDLWDVVRFRVVLPNLATLRDFCIILIRNFGQDIVRSRNYYDRPRGGSLDAYRAAHFELALDVGLRRRFFELQALTLARDAVGLLDHETVYKAGIEDDCDPDRDWLIDLRMAANVFDLRQVRRGMLLRNSL